MAGTLGTITGQIRIDVKQAIAAYAAVRAANIATLLALRSASTVFLAAGAAMGAAGLLIVAGFVKGIKAAADFERQLDFFGAVSNSTAEQMEAVRAKAIELGKDTIFSTGQIAESFVELGKAGVSAEQIIDGVGEAVAHLGAAGDIPLADAAKIITAAIQTFKLGAEDATHVADLLAGAANASIVDIDDLGVSLKYVGGVAASISLPIEDVIDALSLLGKAGIRGSTAGTSLRQILVSLTGTSKKASKLLKELGIITKDGANQFFDAQGKAKPLAEIFQILQDKTKGLTEAQRLAAFKTIFNNRALAAANILAREGAKGFAEMNKEVSKTTAADVAAKRLDNLSGDVERLKSNLEVLFLNAGAPFQNFLRGIVQGVTNMVQAFTDLSPKTQDLIFKITAAAGAALLLMGALSTGIGIVLKFAANMLLLKDALVAVRATLVALRTGFIATWLAALGPIGLIIAAILLVGAAFVLLWKKSETFRNIVTAVGNAIVTAFWAVIHFFTGPFVDFFVMIWNRIVAGFNVMKSLIIAAWTIVKTFFISVMTSIINGIVTGFNAVVGFFAALPGRILTFITNLVTGIVSTLSTLPERVAYIIGFMIGRVIRLWLDWQLFLFRTAIAIVNGIIGFFTALPGRIVAIWNAIRSGVSAAWIATKNFLVSTANSIANGVVSFLNSLPARLTALWNRIKSNAIASWNTLKSAVVNAAKAVANGVVNFLKSLPGKITALWNRIKQNAIASWNELKSKVVSIAKSLPGAVASALSGLGSAIAGAFKRAIAALGNLGQEAFSKAKSIGGSLWNGFKDGLGIHSPSFIEKAMFAIHDTMQQEVGFLVHSVKKIQAASRNVPKAHKGFLADRKAQTIRAAQAAGFKFGEVDTLPSKGDVEAQLVSLDDDSVNRLATALAAKGLKVYLDGKRVDVALSTRAKRGGFSNRD